MSVLSHFFGILFSDRWAALFVPNAFFEASGVRFVGDGVGKVKDVFPGGLVVGPAGIFVLDDAVTMGVPDLRSGVKRDRVVGAADRSKVP